MIDGRAVSAGLALSSGAVRGFAHIGVIAALIEKGVTISELSGSSMGAIVACLYAAGMGIEELKKTAEEINGDIIFDRRIPFISVNRGLKLKKYLKYLLWDKLGVKRLECLKIKVFVICADIIKGQPVVFKSGDIVDILMAASAVPMLFPPYEYSGGVYIDGGVLMPLPASVLKNRGNDIIIGVNAGFGNLMKNPRHILHISAQSLVMMGKTILETQKKAADILIEPDFKGIGFWEFGKIAEIIKIGKTAADETIPLILSLSSGAGRGAENECHVLQC